MLNPHFCPPHPAQPFCCTEVINRLTNSAEQGVEQVTARMYHLSLAITSGTRSAAPVADNTSTVPAAPTFSAVAAGAAATTTPADQGLAPAAAMHVSTDAKAASALVASSTYARLSEPFNIFTRKSTGVSVRERDRYRGHPIGRGIEDKGTQ